MIYRCDPLLGANTERACLENKEVPPADVTQADLLSYISAANSAISPLDLEIRSQAHQLTRQRIYALVNTTSDPITQLATTYSADEIAFVKRVLDYMFEVNNTRRTEAMCISSMATAHLAKAGTVESQRRESGTGGGASQSLTLRDAENMMTRLSDEGWLEKSAKGFYSLSPRALMELKGWLCETYNDEEEEADQEDGPRIRIKMCKACGDIVTVVCSPFWPGRLKILTFICREKDVHVGSAQFDYTQSVREPFSAPDNHKIAQHARPSGMVNILSVRRLSLLATNTCRAREGVAADLSLKLLRMVIEAKMKMRMRIEGPAKLLLDMVNHTPCRSAPPRGYHPPWLSKKEE